jgi:hypothetical protein
MMHTYIFERANGFGRRTVKARGIDEADAAQRVARRAAGRKAGAYPTVVDEEPGWCIATPKASDLGQFRCVGIGKVRVRG